MFSSDNGLHTGEYRLTPGKLTAFDTDIHVPLVVVGPGVPIDRRTRAFAQNIDLAKTFAAIAGAPMPADDGHSLLSLLRGERPADWRNAALIEHHGPQSTRATPIARAGPAGTRPRYEAMRTDALPVRRVHRRRARVLRAAPDPYELRNLAPRLAPDRLAALHADLTRLVACHTADSCWAAAHVAPLPAARR